MPPPFRLLSPAEFALLSPEEKSDYLSRLTFDIQKHLRKFRDDNKRLVDWVLHKDQTRGRK